MPEHSQIEISCERAITLAKATIESIEKDRKMAVDKYINARLKHLNNGFFHKLFKRKDYTREDVVQLDSEEEFGVIWETNAFMYGLQYDTAKDILGAAKAGGKLLLSLDDYRRIS